MKRTFLTIVTLLVAVSASAQYYQDQVNKDMLHVRQPRNSQRKEFIAPSVDGYTAYKADLHTHTIFSDGHLTMEARLREAWQNGLDVMAVTEHLEYRKHEKMMVEYLTTLRRVQRQRPTLSSRRTSLPRVRLWSI